MNISFIKKNLLAFFFTGSFVFLIPKPAGAQEVGGLEELLQEFFTGETVYAQDKNEMQLTLKPAYWKKGELKTLNIPLQFEYGFTNRFQIELQLPYHFLYLKNGQNTNGIGNAEVGFLYNILKGKKQFALSVSMGMGIPVSKKNKESGETEIEWEPSVIMARQIGRAQIHASFAAEITKSELAFNYHVGTVFPFGNWRAALELNRKMSSGENIYLSPGLVWKGLEDFEFGVSFSKGISSGPAVEGIFLMFTYEFF